MRAREFRFIRTSFMGYTREFVKDIFGVKTLGAAPHPDDEVAGAGALYRYIDRALFIHVTDGAPRDLADAFGHGFRSAAEYAEARRTELLAALSGAGVRPADCMQAWVADQQSGFNLVQVALRLRELIEEVEPESILVLPYDGGHPDHDSVCFAVHAAAALLRREGVLPPPLIEYPLYHERNGRLSVMEFIPKEGFDDITVILTEEQKRLKAQMMDSFTTQAGLLKRFPLDFERFRAAPAYDFTAPPHDGGLHYERFNWGVDGRKWRELAMKAMGEIGLEGPL